MFIKTPVMLTLLRFGFEVNDEKSRFRAAEFDQELVKILNGSTWFVQNL